MYHSQYRVRTLSHFVTNVVELPYSLCNSSILLTSVLCYSFTVCCRFSIFRSCATTCIEVSKKMCILIDKINISENFPGSCLSSRIILGTESPRLLLCLSHESQEPLENIKALLNIVDPGPVYHSHPSQHAMESHEDQQLVLS